MIFEVASFSFNIELQTHREIFGDFPQRSSSTDTLSHFASKEQFSDSKFFWGFSTRLGLLNRSDPVTHRIQIERVGRRPVLSTDETQKISPPPPLDGSRTMCQSGVLLEGYSVWLILEAKACAKPHKS